MLLRRMFWLIGIALFLTLVPTSCSRDSQVRKQKYFQSGQHYFEKNLYNEAAIEFINAINVDPNYAEAHHHLAQTYVRMQKLELAFQEFGRALQLQPENYEARIEVANLLVLSHNLAEAKNQIDVLLNQRSSDPVVHSLNSSFLAAKGEIPGAIEEMQKSITLDPERWQFYLSLALLQAKNSQPDAMEGSLQKVIQLSPSSSQARMLLGNYYQSRGRYSEAERQFQDAADRDRNSVEARAAVVRVYLAEGKKADAEDFARRAKADLPNNPIGYRMLADFYFMTGDLDRSIEEYRALTQQHPQDLQVKKNYIQLLLQKGQFGTAASLNNDVLKTHPDDQDALIYRCQIQISTGEANEAAGTLETVIKNEPGNSQAHYVLGVAFQKLGNQLRAESEWREAVGLRADLLDAVRALAGAAIGRNDMEDLDREASEIIRLQPSAPDGYALRALSNINRKRFFLAEKDVQQAIAVAPQNSFGYVQQGNLKLAERQLDGAAVAYQAALDRNPNSKDALRGLMSAYLAQRRVDQAISAASEQITKSPGNSGFYDLLGSALLYNKKDLEGASTAFEKAAELDKNDSNARLMLAQVQAAKGSFDQAIATCRIGLQANPKEAGFNVLLGDLYRTHQDWNSALDAYQKALVIQPENPVASINLARVMLQSGGNLDVALSLAQTARRRMASSADVADTLGWIYYRKGAYESAIDSLREALNLAQVGHSGSNAQFHYHLGMAYAKSGQAALARQQLQQALKLDPSSTDAQAARQQLAELKS